MNTADKFSCKVNYTDIYIYEFYFKKRQRDHSLSDVAFCLELCNVAEMTCKCSRRRPVILRITGTSQCFTKPLCPKALISKKDCIFVLLKIPTLRCTIIQPISLRLVYYTSFGYSLYVHYFSRFPFYFVLNISFILENCFPCSSIPSVSTI